MWMARQAGSERSGPHPKEKPIDPGSGDEADQHNRNGYMAILSGAGMQRWRGDVCLACGFLVRQWRWPRPVLRPDKPQGLTGPDIPTTIASQLTCYR